MKKYKITVFDPWQRPIRETVEEFVNRAAAVAAAVEYRDSVKGYKAEITYKLDELNEDGTERRVTKRVPKNGSKYGKNGVRTQSKTFSFRVDDDITAAFAKVINKGRLINTLLRRALEIIRKEDERDLDEQPDSVTRMFDQRP